MGELVKVIRKHKLEAKLAKLDNAQKLGLLEAGMLVSQRAQQKAPVLTGRLKRSIHGTIPQQAGPGKMETAIGTNVEYARFQEEGTKYIKPHPYLEPALNESKKDIAQLIYKAIIKALQ